MSQGGYTFGAADGVLDSAAYLKGTDNAASSPAGFKRTQDYNLEKTRARGKANGVEGAPLTRGILRPLAPPIAAGLTNIPMCLAA